MNVNPLARLDETGAPMSMRMPLLVLFVLLAGAGAARAQTGAAPVAHPRLSLGISAGAPGSDSEVQLKLAGPPDMGIVRIEAVITLPAGKLDFDKVTGSLLAAEVVKSQTALQQANDGRPMLLLSLDSGSPDRPLPAGVLATIKFKVRKDAGLGVLALGLTVKAFARDGQPVDPVSAFGGRINIQEPAIFYGCFFYMH